MLGERGRLAVALVAVSQFGWPAAADDLVESCVVQFVSDCRAALSTADTYLAQAGLIDGAVLSVTPDGSSIVAFHTTAQELEDGAGIWKRISFPVLGDRRYVTCAFDCSRDVEHAAQLSTLAFRDTIMASAPGAQVVGGELTQIPKDDKNLIWWGSDILHARGWAVDPEQALIAVIHDYGLTLQTMAIERPSP